MTDTCRICQQEMNRHFMGDKDGYRFFACKACGSVMADPWITPDQQEKFFGDIQPQITHVPNPDQEIAHIKATLKKLTPGGQAGKRFIDVNCRNGYGVIAARDSGFEAKGIDSHDFFIEFAQKNYDPALFEQVSVPEYAARGTQAEMVFVRESFCEQSDPEAYAAGLSKILAAGGILYIEEPDGNSFNVPGHFPSWQTVFPPMNFAFYSKRGMTALLARHGLHVQKTFFNWRPIMRMIVVKK